MIILIFIEDINGCFIFQEMLVEGTQVMGLGCLVLKDNSLHLESDSILPYVVTTKDKKVCEWIIF